MNPLQGKGIIYGSRYAVAVLNVGFAEWSASSLDRANSTGTRAGEQINEGLTSYRSRRNCEGLGGG